MSKYLLIHMHPPLILLFDHSILWNLNLWGLFVDVLKIISEYNATLYIVPDRIVTQ